MIPPRATRTVSAINPRQHSAGSVIHPATCAAIQRRHAHNDKLTITNVERTDVRAANDAAGSLHVGGVRHGVLTIAMHLDNDRRSRSSVLLRRDNVLDSVMADIGVRVRRCAGERE